MLLLGTKNPTTQTVATGGTVNLGNVYRKYCRKNACGVKAFDSNGVGVALQHQGIYHIIAVFVGTATTAGDVTIQLLENGVAVAGALSTQTITTVGTEQRTFVIDYYILVDNACLLGNESTLAKTISFTNTGVGATITSAVVNVDKVV